MERRPRSLEQNQSGRESRKNALINFLASRQDFPDVKIKIYFLQFVLQLSLPDTKSDGNLSLESSSNAAVSTFRKSRSSGTSRRAGQCGRRWRSASAKFASLNLADQILFQGLVQKVQSVYAYCQRKARWWEMKLSFAINTSKSRAIHVLAG